MFALSSLLGRHCDDNCYQSEHCVDSNGNASINNRPSQQQEGIDCFTSLVEASLRCSDCNSSYALGKQIIVSLTANSLRYYRVTIKVRPVLTPRQLCRQLSRISCCAVCARHYGAFAIKSKRQNSLTFTLIAQFSRRFLRRAERAAHFHFIFPLIVGADEHAKRCCRNQASLEEATN